MYHEKVLGRTSRMMSPMAALAACWLLSASASTSVAQAPTVNLQSAYLADPIGRAHQIRITAELPGTGMLSLDPNTCTLTPFGDPGICTEIAPRRIEVKVVQLRVADPTGQGRRIYRLEGDIPEGQQFHLIAPRPRSRTHRLVVDEDEGQRRTVTLETPVDEEWSKPVLCQRADYRAVQTRGRVILIATGEHATAGYSVTLEQLPIEIFPPQFRTVSSRPTGVAAQVVTPFEVTTSFEASDRVMQVVVHDPQGQHKVPVKQLDE